VSRHQLSPVCRVFRRWIGLRKSGAGRGAVPKLRWPGRRPSRHEHREPAQDRCLDAAGSASARDLTAARAASSPPRCSSFPSWWQPRPMDDGGRHHAGSAVARPRRCVFRQGSGHVLRGCEVGFFTYDHPRRAQRLSARRDDDDRARVAGRRACRRRRVAVGSASLTLRR
jgi:hypothetical protein